MFKTVIFVAFFLQNALCAQSQSCKKRDFGNGSPVCVCDEESCDFVQPIGEIRDNEAVIFTTDKAGQRLARSVVGLRNVVRKETAAGTNSITVDPSKTLQAIEGFGGAFTDAAGINIASLPQKAQEHLMRSYFDKEGGIEYTIGRVPLASVDFSNRTYSYDDVENDFALTHFALTEEDFLYKIPYILSAQNYSKQTLRLFGSSWSAPAWMKNNGKVNGNSTLLGEPKPNDPYYTTWANYYVRFLEEYAKKNITFYALTAQNEPTTGNLYNYHWQTQAFTAAMQRDFIKYNLGPALRKSAFSNVTIMILDDNKWMLPSWPQTVLRDPEARQYVSHIAVHWYLDAFTPSYVLDVTHREFPGVPMLGTEACIATDGSPQALLPKVLLGSWERAEQYAANIIEDLNHWFVGWVDWNIALDLRGGPNWAKNFVDSPIIVNATSGEFYKQPMFYAMGHFSKFLPKNSLRIDSKAVLERGILATTFVNPDGYIVVIILNKSYKDTNITLSSAHSENMVVSVASSAHSISTVIWKK